MLISCVDWCLLWEGMSCTVTFPVVTVCLECLSCPHVAHLCSNHPSTHHFSLVQSCPSCSIVSLCLSFLRLIPYQLLHIVCLSRCRHILTPSPFLCSPFPSSPPSLSLQTMSTYLPSRHTQCQKETKQKSALSSPTLHPVECLSLTTASFSPPLMALPLVCLIKASTRCYHSHWCSAWRAQITCGMHQQHHGL